MTPGMGLGLFCFLTQGTQFPPQTEQVSRPCGFSLLISKFLCPYATNQATLNTVGVIKVNPLPPHPYPSPALKLFFPLPARSLDISLPGSALFQLRSSFNKAFSIKKGPKSASSYSDIEEIATPDSSAPSSPKLQHSSTETASPSIKSSNSSSVGTEVTE